MTIARNRVINHWRDAKEHADIDDLAFNLEGSNGLDDAIASQEKSTLAEAMSHLAVSERDILEKKYLLGYSYEEIAKENNRSAGSVRIEAFRALRKLRTTLKKKV
jgi:RNA polymerase sigma-70 factor (ECF subfamily)